MNARASDIYRELLTHIDNLQHYNGNHEAYVGARATASHLRGLASGGEYFQQILEVLNAGWAIKTEQGQWILYLPGIGGYQHPSWSGAYTKWKEFRGVIDPPDRLEDTGAPVCPACEGEGVIPSPTLGPQECWMCHGKRTREDRD